MERSVLSERCEHSTGSHRDGRYFTRNAQLPKEKVGGERGIRTLGRVAPTHAFQACAFNHSAISPFRINHLRAVWNSVAQNPPSDLHVPRSLGESALCECGRIGFRCELCQTS